MAVGLAGLANETLASGVAWRGVAWRGVAWRGVEAAGFDPQAVQSQSQRGDIAEIARRNRARVAKLGVNGTAVLDRERSNARVLASVD